MRNVGHRFPGWRPLGHFRPPFEPRGLNCVDVIGGFSNTAGSFSALSYALPVHSGETLSASAEYAVRSRRVQLGFDKLSLFSTRLETGFTVYGQRFHYTPERESSLFAFEKDIPTTAYFTSLDFAAASGFNPLHGVSLSTAVAGLGGTLNTVEPAIEAIHHRRGIFARHVVALHVLGRLLTGYGRVTAPPFNRYYLGGETDLRGFDSWSISPILFVPGSTPVPVLNADGTLRPNTTLLVPSYRIVSAVGDTSLVAMRPCDSTGLIIRAFTPARYSPRLF